jgi:hypothetical protein
MDTPRNQTQEQQLENTLSHGTCQQGSIFDGHQLILVVAMAFLSPSPVDGGKKRTYCIYTFVHIILLSSLLQNILDLTRSIINHYF